jgi:hypothetical protein
MTTFYCLRFETPSTWGARSPYLYPPRTGWPSYNHRHWVPFSLPPTTSRAKVEVFDPTSTRDLRLDSQLNSTRSVEWYNLGADPTENIIPLLMWVAWYHMFQCSGNCTPGAGTRGNTASRTSPIVAWCHRRRRCDLFLCYVCNHCYADQLFTVP